MYERPELVKVWLKGSMSGFFFSSCQDRGVKEDELQSILNYLLTMHEVNSQKSALKQTVGDGGNGGAWSWWQNGHYHLWSYGPLKPVRECESASAQRQHEKWCNNGLNRMYSSVTIISILALLCHMLLRRPPVSMSTATPLSLVLLHICRVGLPLPPLFTCVLFSAGWEHPRCAPAVGGSYVWTPGVHDPCVWSEEWNKVSAAHTCSTRTHIHERARTHTRIWCDITFYTFYTF